MRRFLDRLFGTILYGTAILLFGMLAYHQFTKSISTPVEGREKFKDLIRDIDAARRREDDKVARGKPLEGHRRVQEDRLQILIKSGILHKTDLDSQELWVADGFYKCLYSEKKSVACDFYEYCKVLTTGLRDDGPIIIRDCMTGKQVGKYHPRSDLVLD